MARTTRNQAPRKSAPRRKATVVHDGSAFQFTADLRSYGFEVAEAPLLAFPNPDEDFGNLAVIATARGTSRAERLRAWTRQLCWQGAPLLAVGGAVGPVAEFFGSRPSQPAAQRPNGRLADVTAASRGLFAGLPKEFRLALPGGDCFICSDLNAEFGVTAHSMDGELVGASHVFRPVHLLHAAALQSTEVRNVVLANLLRLLRDRGGRAF